MSIFEPSRTVWTSRMLSILRVVAGLLYMEHGTQKLFDFPPSPQHMQIHLASQFGVAGILETFGGLAIILGLFTRPVAFVAAGEMAVAYFQVHVRRSFFPIVSQGEMAVMLCFVYLFLMFAGGGVWSLDHVIAASRRSASNPRPDALPI